VTLRVITEGDLDPTLLAKILRVFTGPTAKNRHLPPRSVSGGHIRVGPSRGSAGCVGDGDREKVSWPKIGSLASGRSLPSQGLVTSTHGLMRPESVLRNRDLSGAPPMSGKPPDHRVWRPRHPARPSCAASLRKGGGLVDAPGRGAGRDAGQFALSNPLSPRSCALPSWRPPGRSVPFPNERCRGCPKPDRSTRSNHP
jgi:hypothetical protein